MTDLIASAHEGLAEPDARRLAAIEQRLLEQTCSRDRSKTVWWWLAGALVAGAASALWWAVDYDSGKEQKTPVPGNVPPLVAPPAAEQPARADRDESTDSVSAGNPAQKKGPTIYRKEQ